MRHSRLSFISVVLVVLISFPVWGDDLFDLDSGFGFEDEEEAEASSIFDAEPEAKPKEEAKAAPQTARLEIGEAAADVEGEKELRDLSIERRRRIKVVQRKEFHKAGRFEIGVDVGMIGGDWENVLVAGARMAYHLNEHLALQGRFLYGAVSWENETLKQADEADAYVAKSNMTLAGGLSLVFTPFYGKLSFFGNFIPKYDINVSAGGFFYQTRAEDKHQSVDAITNNNGAFQIGFAPRFFIGKNASLSVNCDWFIMKDTRPRQEGGESSYLKSDFMVTLNASMFLPFDR